MTARALVRQTECYRYVTQDEAEWIRANRKIQSLTGTTYYALHPPSLYETKKDVKERLGTVESKDYCIGPIPEDEAPVGDHVQPRTVHPQQLADGTWVFGGGREAATGQEHRLFGRKELV